MDTFIDIISTWMEEQDVPFCLYGCDGKPIAAYKDEKIPDEFITVEKTMTFGFHNWTIYPINIDGEYCGCFCYNLEESDDVDPWDIPIICHLLEIACRF